MSVCLIKQFQGEILTFEYLNNKTQKWLYSLN